MPRKTKEDEKNRIKNEKIKETPKKKTVSKTTKVKEEKEPQKTTKTIRKTTAVKSAFSKTAKKKGTVSKKEGKIEKETKTKREPIKKVATKTTAKPATKSSSKKASNKEKKESQKKKVTTKKATPSSTKSKIKGKEYLIEYYDLPPKYNQTIVKVLAQNPETLFIYWEISKESADEYIAKYGVDFFQKTKPVLLITNKSLDYSFEVDIHDYANCWYLNVPDTKCEYVVELTRKVIKQTNKIDFDHICISKSNRIEIPNDHVLFYKQNDIIEFQNVKTKSYQKIIDITPLKNNMLNIYNKEYELSKTKNKFDLNNPSSNS